MFNRLVFDLFPLLIYYKILWHLRKTSLQSRKPNAFHRLVRLTFDRGFSISIARLLLHLLRCAAYHGYSIAFDGHPRSSSGSGSGR